MSDWPAFLLDANLSPKVARFLHRMFGLDVLVLHGAQRDLPDRAIIEMAYAQRRVIITLDRDFADHFVRSDRPRIGIVLLELPNTHRTTPAVNAVLARFFGQEAERFDLRGGLTIVTEVDWRTASPHTPTN